MFSRRRFSPMRLSHAGKPIPTISMARVLAALEKLNRDNIAQYGFRDLAFYVTIREIEDAICIEDSIPAWKMIHRLVKRALASLIRDGKVDCIYVDMSSLIPWGETQYCSWAVFPPE
jgi:hypothetical protein